jgi:hypothetical protein
MTGTGWEEPDSRCSKFEGKLTGDIFQLPTLLFDATGLGAPVRGLLHHAGEHDVSRGPSRTHFLGVGILQC